MKQADWEKEFDKQFGFGDPKVRKIYIKFIAKHIAEARKDGVMEAFKEILDWAEKGKLSTYPATYFIAGLEALKKKLEERGGEVVLHPELFTTMEARQIQGNTSMTDASAAALILKNYLDSVNQG